MHPIAKRSRMSIYLGAAIFSACLVLAWIWFRADPLDALVESFLEEMRLPGAVVAFGLPGEEPALRAYGLADVAAGVPMAVNDRFKIASLSKPITAAAVLELIRRQGSALDTPFVDLLPGSVAAADARVATITLRHLLQHSGGWDHAETVDPFFLGGADASALVGMDAGRITDCAPIADALLARPLQFDPGDRYAYSNVGYCWLGRILAAASSTYGQAVHALLPETAAMTLDETALTVTHALRAGDEGLLVNRPGVIAAAGGWIASAPDYFRFASRPVDPVALDRPPYASGIQHYGLGWRVWQLDEGIVLTHFGAMPGAFGIVVKRIDGPVFVALFNGRPLDEGNAFDRLFEGVRALPFWGE